MFVRLARYSAVRVFTGGLYFALLYVLTAHVGLYFMVSALAAFAPSYALEFLVNTRWTYGR